MESDEAAFRALVEGAPDPVLLYQDACVAYANPAAAKYLGYETVAELAGMSAADLIAEHSPGDEARLARERWRRTEATGRVAEPADLVIRRRNGEIVLAERRGGIVSWRGRPAQVAMLRDVTDRRRSEEELRRSEERFRCLIEGSHDAIVVSTWERVYYVNPTLVAYLGLESAEELLNKPASMLADELIHPEDRGRTRDGLWANVKNRTSYPVHDVRIRHRDGSYRVADFHVSHIVFDGVPAQVTHLRDQTHRRELESQLRLADRLASVGLLAAGVAHEINNPLGYVIANLQLMNQRVSSIEAEVRRTASDALSEDMRRSCDIVTEHVRELVKMLEISREGADKVRVIVGDLKALSRADDGPPELLDVRWALDSTLSLTRHEVARYASLVREYGDVPLVQASSARLGQVFLNLIVNAVQAFGTTKDAAQEIRIRTLTDDEERAVVEIADNGPGIAAHILPRVFDPFFTTKPAGVGTGLGLSICQAIVSGLGGQISIRSEVGRGTTVRVALRGCVARGG
jgi:PAS domain S-box-containing protein